MEDLSKTWVSTGKQFEDFRRKEEQKHNSRPFKITPWNKRPLKTTVYSDTYCESYQIISLGPKSFLKTQNFDNKKRVPFQWKKEFGLFFLVL